MIEDWESIPSKNKLIREMSNIQVLFLLENNIDIDFIWYLSDSLGLKYVSPDAADIIIESKQIPPKGNN